MMVHDDVYDYKIGHGDCEDGGGLVYGYVHDYGNCHCCHWWWNSRVSYGDDDCLNVTDDVEYVRFVGSMEDNLCGWYAGV